MKARNWAGPQEQREEATVSRTGATASEFVSTVFTELLFCQRAWLDRRNSPLFEQSLCHGNAHFPQSSESIWRIPMELEFDKKWRREMSGSPPVVFDTDGGSNDDEPAEAEGGEGSIRQPYIFVIKLSIACAPKRTFSRGF
jgi:hypothetical protein